MKNVVALLEHRRRRGRDADEADVFEAHPRLSCSDFAKYHLGRGKDIRALGIAPPAGATANDVAELLVDDNTRYLQAQPTRGVQIAKFARPDGAGDTALLGIMLCVLECVARIHAGHHHRVQHAGLGLNGEAILVECLARRATRQYWRDMALSRAFTCGWDYEAGVVATAAANGTAALVAAREVDPLKVLVSQSHGWVTEHRIPPQAWSRACADARHDVPRYFLRGRKMVGKCKAAAEVARRAAREAADRANSPPAVALRLGVRSAAGSAGSAGVPPLTLA